MRGTVTAPQQLDLFSADMLPPAPPGPEKPDDPKPDREPVFRQPRRTSPSQKYRIVLAGNTVEYELLRSNRKTIGLTINEHGLRITAPKWVTLKAVEKAIRQKEKWITEKLGIFHGQSGAGSKKHALSFSEGETIYLLGEPYTLRLHTGPGESVVADDAKKEIHVTTADTTKRWIVREMLMIWFSRKALDVFTSRMPVYADRLDLSYRGLSLSSAKSRWGSCCSTGHIRLNWRLIHFGMEFIDYVIVHELAHLREMNHSKRYWDIVSVVFPDYKAIRKALHQQSKLLSPVW